MVYYLTYEQSSCRVEWNRLISGRIQEKTILRIKQKLSVSRNSIWAARPIIVFKFLPRLDWWKFMLQHMHEYSLFTWGCMDPIDRIVEHIQNHYCLLWLITGRCVMEHNSSWVNKEHIHYVEDSNRWKCLHLGCLQLTRCNWNREEIK